MAGKAWLYIQETDYNGWCQNHMIYRRWTLVVGNHPQPAIMFWVLLSCSLFNNAELHQLI